MQLRAPAVAPERVVEGKYTDVPKKFDVEGQEVTCYELDGHRLWRCGCADFARRLEHYGEGFCAHTAVAMMRAIERGEMDP